MAKYFDYLVLKLPAIGTLAKELNTARTARTLSSLLFSGVSIIRALEITEDVVQNVHYKAVLEKAGEAIKKGDTWLKPIVGVIILITAIKMIFFY